MSCVHMYIILYMKNDYRHLNNLLACYRFSAFKVKLYIDLFLPLIYVCNAVLQNARLKLVLFYCMLLINPSISRENKYRCKHLILTSNIDGFVNSMQLFQLLYEINLFKQILIFNMFACKVLILNISVDDFPVFFYMLLINKFLNYTNKHS